MVNGQRLAELTNRGRSQLVASDNSASRQLAESPAELKDNGNTTVAPPVLAQAKSEAYRSNAKLADSETVMTAGGTLAADAPAPAARALASLAKAPAENNFACGQVHVQFAAATAQNFNSVAQNSFKNTVAHGQGRRRAGEFSGAAKRQCDPRRGCGRVGLRWFLAARKCGRTKRRFRRQCHHRPAQPWHKMNSKKQSPTGMSCKLPEIIFSG